MKYSVVHNFMSSKRKAVVENCFVVRCTTFICYTRSSKVDFTGDEHVDTWTLGRTDVDVLHFNIFKKSFLNLGFQVQKELVKRYNQELCMSSITKCFTKRLRSRPLQWFSNTTWGISRITREQVFRELFPPSNFHAVVTILIPPHFYSFPSITFDEHATDTLLIHVPSRRHRVMAVLHYVKRCHQLLNCSIREPRRRDRKCIRKVQGLSREGTKRNGDSRFHLLSNPCAQHRSDDSGSLIPESVGCSGRHLLRNRTREPRCLRRAHPPSRWNKGGNQHVTLVVRYNSTVAASHRIRAHARGVLWSFRSVLDS